MNTILWWNLWKLPLATAVQEAADAHKRRLGSAPTHVILPLGGEYPVMVGGLTVETDKRVKGQYMQVYATEGPQGGLPRADER